MVAHAPPKDGAFPEHELASVFVGSRSYIGDLKVANAEEARDVYCP